MPGCLTDVFWKISYGPADDRLRDFYIPALSRSVTCTSGRPDFSLRARWRWPPPVSPTWCATPAACGSSWGQCSRRTTCVPSSGVREPSARCWNTGCLGPRGVGARPRRPGAQALGRAGLDGGTRRSRDPRGSPRWSRRPPAARRGCRRLLPPQRGPVHRRLRAHAGVLGQRERNPPRLVAPAEPPERDPLEKQQVSVSPKIPADREERILFSVRGWTLRRRRSCSPRIACYIPAASMRWRGGSRRAGSQMAPQRVCPQWEAHGRVRVACR
jgi:hypothetical protein